MTLANELKENNFTHQTKHNQIWAVGGGKGGVGKSLVTANT